jgi:hypothetical protein
VQAALAATAGPPQEVGQWGPLTPWPVVGVHTALLPNGNVLSFDSVGDSASENYTVHNFTRATVWNPVTESHTNVDARTGYNIFCAGLAHLPNGDVFLAGGNKDAQLNGIGRHTCSTRRPTPGRWAATWPTSGGIPASLRWPTARA